MTPRPEFAAPAARDPGPRRTARDRSGLTLLEVTIAIAIIGVSAMMALSVMTSTSQADEELRDRAVALRAALSRMEAIRGYDDGGAIQNLLTWVAQPEQATFDIDGLHPVLDANGIPLPCGTVTVDASDILRVQVIVTVTWNGRKGVRSLSLPFALTEMVP